jgi:alpha/beta superfamily hydrolase
VNLDVDGPAGRLEALLDLPAGEPRAAVVLAHPHPQHGGTMRARVLHEASRGFRRAGAAVLRFNFRGVGRSAGGFTGGAGERQDFRAALDEVARRWPGRPLWAAGYSFGAWVALAEGAGDLRVAALVAIAPLVDQYDFDAAAQSPKAKFLIQAERDELSPIKAVHRFYARVSEPRELIVIDGADHAFDGKASEVGDAIEDLFEDFGR